MKKIPGNLLKKTWKNHGNIMEFCQSEKVGTLTNLPVLLQTPARPTSDPTMGQIFVNFLRFWGHFEKHWVCIYSFGCCYGKSWIRFLWWLRVCCLSAVADPGFPRQRGTNSNLGNVKLLF